MAADTLDRARRLNPAFARKLDLASTIAALNKALAQPCLHYINRREEMAQCGFGVTAHRSASMRAASMTRSVFAAMEITTGCSSCSEPMLFSSMPTSM